MGYLLPILIGVVASVVASFIFLSLMYRFRPKLEISQIISKSKSHHGDIVYRIKVINRSPRPLINIKAELRLQMPKAVPGGMVVSNIKTFDLIKTDIMQIDGYSNKDAECKYAHRFTTKDNIDTQWSDDARSLIIFRIYGVDSLSGFGKVFTQKYHTKRNSIVEGDFAFGDNMNVN